MKSQIHSAYSRYLTGNTSDYLIDLLVNNGLDGYGIRFLFLWVDLSIYRAGIKVVSIEDKSMAVKEIVIFIYREGMDARIDEQRGGRVI